MKSARLLFASVLGLVGPAAAPAHIVRIDVTTVESPTFGGYRWPGVGAYEKIVGVAHGELDPQDPKNAPIVDLDLAPVNARGRVEYAFDFYLLKPVTPRKGAHAVVYQPAARGHLAGSAVARLPPGDDPGAALTDPSLLAQAFFLARGYTLVCSGWEPAVPGRDAGPLHLVPPTALHRDGSPITGPAYEYIVDAGRAYPLAYPAASSLESWATLTHRVHLDDPPEVVAAGAWEYEGGGTAIRLAGGPFVAGDIYEFSYTATRPTVNGVALAAVRDFNAWLRSAATDAAGHPNPLAGDVERLYSVAQAEPARMLNDFRRLGFNQAESGAKVFDGMLQELAAGDGANLNSRFSQPDRAEYNRQDHRYDAGRFPFANVPTTDPVSGVTDSRLARCQASTTCPVSVEMLSANDYWTQAGSLLHTTPDGRRDLPYSRYTRDYLIAGTPGDPADAPASCQQPPNPLEAAPVARALFLALDAWTRGTAPPASRVPRLTDGTLVAARPRGAVGFPAIPGVTFTGLATTRYRLDFGADYDATGIATRNPPAMTAPYQDNPRNGPIYPSAVPATDGDGNDRAGVRLADVEVPLATYTGWALRAGAQADDGCEAAGQRIALARTRAERLASGDPRPSVEERYPTADAYRQALLRALDGLVRDRLLLCEDVAPEVARLTAAGTAAGVPAGAAAPGTTPVLPPPLPHCRS